MAPSEEECRTMIDAADERNDRLMIAYRLHFEEVNMEVARKSTSFGSADVEYYGVVGTEGELRVEPAYSYVENLSWSLLQGGEVVERKTIPQRDQFAPELVHLARCIREGRPPEPDGLEGLADVRIVLATHEAARAGERVAISPVERPERPDTDQVMKKPGVEKPEEIKASSPSE